MPNPYVLPALGHLPRVVGPYVQTAVDTAAEFGVTPQQLAAYLGMPEDGLSPPPEALAVETYIALLNAGAELCDDRFFGLHVGAARVKPLVPVLTAARPRVFFRSGVECVQAAKSQWHGFATFWICMQKIGRGERIRFDLISRFPSESRTEMRYGYAVCLHSFEGCMVAPSRISSGLSGRGKNRCPDMDTRTPQDTPWCTLWVPPLHGHA